MIQNHVYIDSDLIDLEDNTSIAYTFVNTLPTSLTERYASYTNTFKAPFTETNNKKFGFKNNIKSKQVYTYYNVKWVQNGVEIISNGVAVVNRANKNYEVQILDGIISFMSLLGDEKIDDLYVLDTSLITWSASTIDSKRATSVGLVSPALSYGQLNAVSPLTNNEFTGSLSGWEAVDRDNFNTSFPALQNKPWAHSGNMAVAELDTFFDATAGTSNGYTEVRRQPYFFIKGQDYTINIDGRYSAGEDSDIYVRLYLKDGITYKDYFVDTLTNSYADHGITITPDQDYYYFGFWAVMTYDGPTATTGSDIELRDVSIEMILKIGNVYLPSVWYADIINRIIQETGYNNTGEIFSNDIYSRLIIPFCKDEFKYTGLFNDCREFKAKLSSPQTITSDGNIIFDEILKKDRYGYYDPTDGNYSQNNDYEFEIDPSSDTRSFYSKFTVSLEVQVNTGSVTIQLLSQGDGVLTQRVLSSPGRYTVNLSLNKYDASEGYNMDGGETVSVYCDVGGSTNVTILRGEFSNVVDGINQDATPTFYTCEILPELKKRDLLSDFFIRFGLIPKDKHKWLTVKTFEEVITDKANAVDWTNKRDTSIDDDVSYTNGYYQNNYFRYPINDDYFTDDPGNIVCDNVTLERENTIYESLFCGSADISAGDNVNYVYVGYIPIWDTPPTAYPTNTENSFDNDPGLRLMVTREKKSDEYALVYDGSPRTDYLVANFSLPDEGYLNWKGFLKEHYGALMNAIEQNKSVVRYYHLTQEDIINLDPHTMVYDDGSYFIINRVPNYIPGQISKVELYKVQ